MEGALLWRVRVLSLFRILRKMRWVREGEMRGEEQVLFWAEKMFLMPLPGLCLGRTSLLYCVGLTMTSLLRLEFLCQALLVPLLEVLALPSGWMMSQPFRHVLMMQMIPIPCRVASLPWYVSTKVHLKLMSVKYM